MPLNTGIVFGLGNPLLDICAEVNKDFLNKHSLKANDAILIDDDKRGELINDLKEYELQYVPGGSNLNTLKILQWVCQKKQPKVCTFMGAIGSGDEFGLKMEELVEKDGLNAVYMKVSQSTGSCFVLLTEKGKYRSLAAYLGAANHFHESHLKQYWDSCVVPAKYVYCTGFHLSVSPSSMKLLATHVRETKGNNAGDVGEKYFCLNLSAPFVPAFYSKDLLELLGYTDILFGNETEAAALCKMLNYNEKTPLEEVSKKVGDEVLKGEHFGMVVITQGEDPIIVYNRKTKELRKFPVEKLKPDEIVDSNGAGDAFVAGFMSQFIQDKSLDECISVAIKTAKVIIKQNGVAVPSTSCDFA